MQNSDELGGLLDRANAVFEQAGELGRAFEIEQLQNPVTVDPCGWNRHTPAFKVFCNALLELRDAMQNPPLGIALVAQHLLDAARIAKVIDEALKGPDAQAEAAFLHFFPELNEVCKAGLRAVKELTTQPKPNGPFDFADQTTALTQLQRFPDTVDGHVAFLEFVRDAVRRASDAKHVPFEHWYANETLESMVSGIKWVEAGLRASRITGLPPDTIGKVSDVLQRELSVDTLDQIEKPLGRTIRDLRNALESKKQIADSTVIEPPELTEIKRWLLFDGVKGYWGAMTAAAQYWGLSIDHRHQDIAFLVEQIFHGDPSDRQIRQYLFEANGVLPSDDIDLETLRLMLKRETENLQFQKVLRNDWNSSILNKQTTIGPVDSEFSDEHQALPKAQQPELKAKTDGRAESAQESDSPKELSALDHRTLPSAAIDAVPADDAKNNTGPPKFDNAAVISGHIATGVADRDANVTETLGLQSKKELRAFWLAQAMLLVQGNPNWSDAEIARKIGKDKSTLSRNKTYKIAAAMARGKREDRHAGQVNFDSESGNRDVEAYANDPPERDWDDEN